MVVFDRKYYQKVIEEYGYNPLDFQDIDFHLEQMNRDDLRKMWICHQNGEAFSQQANQGTKTVFTTGFGLSGSPHLGSISQIMKAVRLQRQGYDVQIVLGDLDAYNGKKTPYAVTQELVGKFKSFIQAVGFDADRGVLRSQSEERALPVLRTASWIANFITDEMFDNAEEDLHEFYMKKGKVDATMTFNRKFSLNLMIADFVDLYLTHQYANVMVFLGIDEHQYVYAAQQVLKNLKADGQFPIQHTTFASIYSGIIKGFNDYPKMSKSFPESSLNVTMSRDEIIKRVTVEEGDYDVPENNVVYQMISTASLYTPHDIDQAYQACTERGTEWERWKREYALQIADILSKWN